MSGIQIKDDRPVNFAPLLTIGNAELTSCTRCGATVMRAPYQHGDMAELVHRKWHEEIGP